MKEMTHYNFTRNTIQIDLDDLKNKFHHEIDYFKEYVKFNNDKLSSRRAQLDVFLKQDIQENPDNEIFLRDIYYMDYIKLPSYFYHSSIVSLYSLLENNLNNICDKIQMDTGFVIGLSDLSGSNIIQKARKFLSKFAKIDFMIVDKEWLRISDYQKLRNLIVHQNSQLKSFDLSEKESEDIKTTKKFNGIEIDKHSQIFYITKGEILLDFLALIEKFILSIISQIDDRRFEKFSFVDIYGDLPF